MEPIENNRKSKSGKYLKKKKKRFPVMQLIFLSIAFLALGCWFLSKMDIDSPVEETTVPTETAAQTQSIPEQEIVPSVTVPHAMEYEMPQAYREILSRYQQAVAEKWDFIQCEDNQICYMVMFLPDLSELGYHIVDLDGNGVRELIISNGSEIYDLYTLNGSEHVWLLSGGERNGYHLCQDGFIANRGANGAASFVHSFYYLKDGELVLKESVFFDDMSKTAKWTLTGEGIESPEPIDEKRYQEITTSYEKVEIPMNPME